MMARHTKTGQRRVNRKPSRLLLVVSLIASLVMVIITTASTASSAPAAGKPVIGKPVAGPAQPLPGKRFAVSFKVTRSGGGALTRATMICDPSIAGQVIPHAESFRPGRAQLSFVVPTDAAGKLLKVKLTVKAGGQSASRVANFRIKTLPMPRISIGDASVPEGNAGTTTLSLPVTLSSAAKQAVLVDYSTTDGTATAPADYAEVSGTVAFRPGEKAKTISVSVVGDTTIEMDETLTVTLSNPVGATIEDDMGIGVITNDDTAVPATPGAYMGTTENLNNVYLTVTPDRRVTSLRVNDLPGTCDGPLHIIGGSNWGSRYYAIQDDGTFTGETTWSGSDFVDPDAEWTYWHTKVSGFFNAPTIITGTLSWDGEINFRDHHYHCSSGTVTWSATLQR